MMELIEGEPLDTFDDLSVFSAINILLDILSCIEDLARVGTAHLNLKPANIYVTNPPSNDRAMVLGFGTSATLLHAGAGVPVPAFDPHLAPELVAGNLLPTDQAWRTDLFSFGVIACGVLGAEIEGRWLFPSPRDLARRGAVDAPGGRTSRGDSRSDHGARSHDEGRITVRSPGSADPCVARSAGAVGSRAALRSRLHHPRCPSTPTRRTPPSIPPGILVTADHLPSRDSGAETQCRRRGRSLDEDGWPEVLFDDPELPASLDEQPKDTDVRNPIPVDVWVPDAVAPVMAARPPSRRSPETDRRWAPGLAGRSGGGRRGGDHSREHHRVYLAIDR